MTQKPMPIRPYTAPMPMPLRTDCAMRLSMRRLFGAKIGGNHIRVAPDFIRLALRDQAAEIEYGDLFGNIHHQVHVVLNQEDRGAGLDDPAQECCERIGFLPIEAR